MSGMQYPDAPDAPSYQATAGQQNGANSKKEGEKTETCCGRAAKFWVTIIGILTLVSLCADYYCVMTR